MCSRATLVGSDLLHFRATTTGSSPARMTNQYGCGICYRLPILGRRLWTLLAFSHTLDGFSLRLEKAISCLCHLMHCCLTLLISSPFHTPVLPLLISLGLTSALDGTVVIGVCRPLLTFSCYLYIRGNTCTTGELEMHSRLNATGSGYHRNLLFSIREWYFYSWPPHRMSFHLVRISPSQAEEYLSLRGKRGQRKYKFRIGHPAGLV